MVCVTNVSLKCIREPSWTWCVCHREADDLVCFSNASFVSPVFKRRGQFTQTELTINRALSDIASVWRESSLTDSQERRKISWKSDCLGHSKPGAPRPLVGEGLWVGAGSATDASWELRSLRALDANSHGPSCAYLGQSGCCTLGCQEILMGDMITGRNPFCYSTCLMCIVDFLEPNMY